MKKRRALWLGGGLAVVVLVGTALLAPASPVNLPDLLGYNGQYQGRSTRSWLKDLDHSDPEVRWRAAHALGAIGTEAPQTVGPLATMMVEDPEPRPRAEAALALSKMAPAARAAVPELALALEDDADPVRMNAALALSQLGTEARPAIPALIRAVQDERNDHNLGGFLISIQGVAILALGRASAGTAEGLPTLIAALETAPSLGLKLTVVRALGEVGPPAREAVPRLLPLLEDDSEDMRQFVKAALGKIGWKADRAVSRRAGRR